MFLVYRSPPLLNSPSLTSNILTNRSLGFQFLSEEGFRLVNHHSNLEPTFSFPELKEWKSVRVAGKHEIQSSGAMAKKHAA